MTQSMGDASLVPNGCPAWARSPKTEVVWRLVSRTSMRETQLLKGTLLRPVGSCCLTPELPGHYVHILMKYRPAWWCSLQKEPPEGVSLRTHPLLPLSCHPLCRSQSVGSSATAGAPLQRRECRPPGAPESLPGTAFSPLIQDAAPSQKRSANLN